MTYEEIVELQKGLAQLVQQCHGASKNAGWWSDLATGLPLPMTSTAAPYRAKSLTPSGR
jgi:hypothetical protein